jgi:uncharacterized protein (DUF433 family)
MITSAPTEQIPIRVDTDKYGSIRVGNTRVLLDLVIYAYWQGKTPESITQSYPSLTLEDVYLAIGYYLRHRDEVDAYLREREAEADRFRQAYEAANPPTITRQMLLDRLKAKQQNES